MKYRILLALTCLSLGAASQTFEQHYLQFASTGLNSRTGADLIDFDGDGRLDVLFGFESRNELMVLKNSEVNFTPIEVFDSLNGYTHIKTIDFNTDGFDDFLMVGKKFSTNYLYLYLNDGSYNYTATVVGTIGFDRIRQLEAGDLDSDGDLDIAFTKAANDNRIYIYENQGNNNFLYHPGVLDFSG